MRISRRFGRLAVLTGTLLALVSLPQASLAAPPERVFRGTFSDTFQDEVCGIPVTGTVEGAGSFTVFFDKAGNVTRVQGTGPTTLTLTATNGQSVTIFSAGRFRGTETINPDGTITFVQTYTGVPERITDGAGNVLVMDVGRIVFTTTINPETGEVLFDEVTFVAGPHPEAESDFALFCEVITEALT